MPTETRSAKEVAREFGTDARTFRKFLREHLPEEEQPGQGGRYAFTPGQVKKLKKAFDNWEGGKTSKAEAEGEGDEPKAKKSKGKGKSKAKQEELEEIEELTDSELEEIEDLDDLPEPDADDLEDVEADGEEDDD